ncbi:MAG: hypothetical protein S4CHLAM81_15510 [Chlamydiales bacterium]|nr:hypothetical protein [Chlamydiales bacterium]MCH9636320.1 hypothetical protein [Chlamydiales bacterium]MCH9703754.1 hypothetical protein [Chlamydiota bacterium]
MEGTHYTTFRKTSAYTPAKVLVGVSAVAALVSGLALALIARTITPYQALTSTALLAMGSSGALSLALFSTSLVIFLRQKRPIEESVDSDSDSEYATPMATAAVSTESLEAPGVRDLIEEFDQQILTPKLEPLKAMLKRMIAKAELDRKCDVDDYIMSIHDAAAATFAVQFLAITEGNGTKDELFDQLSEVVDTVVGIIPRGFINKLTGYITVCLVARLPEEAIRGAARDKFKEGIDKQYFNLRKSLHQYKDSDLYNTILNGSGLLAEFIIVYRNKDWYKIFDSHKKKPLNTMMIDIAQAFQ